MGFSDWLGARAAARAHMRAKKTLIEKERNAAYEERLAAKDEVIKATRMAAYAYQKALATYVTLEEDGMVPRIEKSTSGEYSEIAEALVDQYVPGMLRGAAKAAIRKNKDKINKAVEGLVNAQAEKMMGEAEQRGEIKRLDTKTREEMQ